MISCEYSTGSSWILGAMSGDYCEATGLIFTDDIIVQFRATNNGGTTTGTSTTYRYDAIGPTTPILINPTFGEEVNVVFVDIAR